MIQKILDLQALRGDATKSRLPSARIPRRFYAVAPGRFQTHKHQKTIDKELEIFMGNSAPLVQN